MFSVGAIVGEMKLRTSDWTRDVSRVKTDISDVVMAVKRAASTNEMKLNVREFTRGTAVVKNEMTAVTQMLKATTSPQMRLQTVDWQRGVAVVKQDVGTLVSLLKGVQAEASTATSAIEHMAAAGMAVQAMNMGRGALALSQIPPSLRAVSGSGSQAASMLASVSGNLVKIGTGIGAVITLGIALKKTATFLKDCADEAIQFESAFAGVRKTVDATEGEFIQFSREIRELSTQIPISAEKLARLAEAGGQLGIANESLMAFTETMAKLGTATNMSAEEAATSLARWANITQLAQGDIDRLASTIVELGNNFATTEREITDLGLRLAGVGSQIGMSDGEIAGFAASLSSVGLEIEAAGTAMSRVMADLANAVATGSPELEVFAVTAGKTSEEFGKLFKADPADAILEFVEGLKGFDKAGGNVYELLQKIGFEDVRVRDALLRISKASDVLRHSMELQGSAWEENSALTEEASKRFATTESHLEITKNKFSALKEEIGNNFIPTLNSMLDPLGDAIDKLVALDQKMVGFAGYVKDFHDWTVEEIALGKGTKPRSPVPDVATNAMDELNAAIQQSLNPGKPAEEIAAEIQKQKLLASGVILTKQLGAAAGTTSEQVDKINESMKKIGGEGGNAVKKAASEFEKIQSEAANLRLDVFPEEALNAAIRNVTELASKLPAIVDDEAVSAKFSKLWEEFRDRGIDTAAEVDEALQGLAPNYRDSFLAAMKEVDAEFNAKKYQELFLQIAPGEQVIAEAKEMLKTLQDAGKLDDENESLLGTALWEKLRDVSVDMLDGILSKMLEIDSAGPDMVDWIRDAQAAAKTNEVKERGTATHERLNPSISFARDIGAELEGLKEIGHLDDDTSLLAKEFWEQLKDLGTDAISEIIKKVRVLYPEFAESLEDLKKQQDNVKKAANLDDLADDISGVGGAVAALSPKFAAVGRASQAAAYVVKAAAEIMRIAAGVATAGWSEVIQLILSAVAALGIFGDKEEKELHGMAEAMDELGDAVDRWADELTDAIVQFVRTGKAEFKDFVDMVLDELLKIAISNFVIEPIVDFAGGFFKEGGVIDDGREVRAFARGGAFDALDIEYFAKGGRVTDGPETFRMAGDKVGVRGEAGPEAILPLERMSDGRLGVVYENKSMDLAVLDLAKNMGKVLAVVNLVRNAVPELPRGGGIEGSVMRMQGTVWNLTNSVGQLVPAVRAMQSAALLGGRAPGQSLGMMAQSRITGPLNMIPAGLASPVPIQAIAVVGMAALALRAWKKHRSETEAAGGKELSELEAVSRSVRNGQGGQSQNASRGGDVQVNVHAYGLPPEAVQVKDRGTVDGRRVMDVIVTAVRRGMAEGAFDNDMALNYGLPRRG